MLTLLIYTPPKRSSFWKRLHHRLFWPPLTVEKKEIDGVELRYIFCNPFRRIHWKKVTAVCGGAAEILLPEGLEAPPYTHLKVFEGTSENHIEAARAALSVLKAAAPDPRRSKILLYDREGRFGELAAELSKLCNEMMVVTDRGDEYEALGDELLADTGKPLRVSEEMPDTRYGLLVAPGGFDRVVATDPGTIVFASGEKNLPLSGVVYYRYQPDLPEEWKKYCPGGISWERFGAALFAAGRREGKFDFPIKGYRQRICTDTAERVVERIREAVG